MRLRTPVLAGFLALGAMVLLALALVRHEAPAEERTDVTRASVCAPVAASEPDWTGRVRLTLERMHVPIRGKNLEALLRTVDRSSKRFGIDPLAVLGIIAIESEFDPLAVSPRGAMGLMQLRADTARELAEDLGIAWRSDDLLLDPDVNVLLGSFYLSRLINRFGDIDAALAAFHDGPGRVQLFKGQGESVPLEYANRVWDAIVRLDLRAIA
jgi:soluble lytic murein transglycosylase-like protein